MIDHIYGTISLQKKSWNVSCEPHVRNRLKRVFPQVLQHAADTIAISNTTLNSHELLWFISRFPMSLSADDMATLKKQSKAYLNQQNDIGLIINHKKPSIQFDLKEPAFEFQKTAANLLLSVRGLLLADDVGLGKTLSSICPMVIPENLPALFVTMTHLPKQIEAEVNRFAPHLKTHIIKSTKPYVLVDEHGDAPDVIICSYSKLNGWAEHLSGLIKYVVFDEIQELRTGAGSLKYEAARHISEQATLRLGLSATPIYNYGNEFYNVINILRPNVFGSQVEFYREWCSNETKIKDPKAFGAFLRNEGIMLLRKRAEVNRELPPMQSIVQHINSDTAVLDKIKGHAAELAKVILQTSQDFKGQKLRATEEFNMLMRQSTGIAKAPYVAEFVKMIVESGESVILFGWHREVYNIWLNRLAEYNPVLYTGTESIAAKGRSKERFMNGDSKVLIISLRSGAGLDGLQYHPNCSIAVFGELDWSHSVHTQCIGRLGRDGQSKSIAAYYLLSESGSDPIISEVLGIKKQQLDGVKNIDDDLVAAINVDKSAMKRLAAQYLQKNNISI